MASAQKPAAFQMDGEVLLHNSQRYKLVKEGLACILVPECPETNRPGKKDSKSGETGQQVFYNPIQQFNRDLSVLAIKAYGAEVLEKKTEARTRRKEISESKKRKRQEQKQHSERVSKIERLSDQAAERNLDTNDAPPEGADDVAATSQAHDASEEQTSTTPTTGSGAQDKASSINDSVAQEAQAPAAEETGGDSRGSQLRILDALSATGLRALRYAHELPFPVSVTANDLLSSAVKSIKLNVEYNKLEDKILVTHSNALAHMYSLIANELSREPRLRDTNGRYDVIDLDPYGTAANFFDAAVQAVRDDGGLLCVTCTDAGVWASQGYPEKAFALYGGIPMKGNMSHEAGLRIILHAIATSAARYGRAIEPLLSLSVDFYCRIFVRINRSPASVKYQAGKTMIVYNCDQGCGAWTTQLLLRNKAAQNKKGTGMFYKHTFAPAPTAEPFCDHCGTKTRLAGPMYAGRIHSTNFIQRILKDLPTAFTGTYGTTERIRGMLQTALEELPDNSFTGENGKGMAVEAKGNGDTEVSGKGSKEDGVLAALDPHPFFVLTGQLAKAVHCTAPSDDALRGALRRLGYHTTRSHCRPGSIKTDAPWSVIWAVMREWVRQKAPIKEENIKPESAAYRLLKMSQESSNAKAESNKVDEQAEKIDIVFDEKLGRERNREKLVRYQINPRQNWGPMNRAQGH